MTNLNLAFDIAEEHLDIPKMLDAEGNFDTAIFYFNHSTHSRTVTFFAIFWKFSKNTPKNTTKPGNIPWLF